MPTTTRLALVAAVLGVPLVLAPAAHGQQRADQGARQEAGQFRGGQNPRRVDSGAAFRARNNVVTGEVAGGRQFRGVLGYGAPDAFRGELGSDDLFEFRAGSALSDPRLLSLGAAYKQLRYGGIGDQLNPDVLSVQRSGQGATAGDVTSGYGLAGSARGPLAPTRLRRDLDDALTGLSRVELDLLSAEPTEVGAAEDQEGTIWAYQASPSGTLVPRRAALTPTRLGLSTLDFVSLRTQALTNPGEAVTSSRPFQVDYGLATSTLVEPMGGGATPREGERLDTRRAGYSVPRYDRILEEISNRYAALERDTSAEDRAAAAADVETARIDALQLEMDDLRRSLTGEAPSGLGGAPQEGETEGETAEVDPWDASRVGALLRHGQKIERLSTEDATRFNELLAEGEGRLRSGEYFRAERSFTRALRFVPGHPMATIGLVHARLGSGLTTSAATVLRDLLASQPELIDARFDERIVPNRPRLVRALERARDGLDADSPSRAASALVVAYVGRLTEDQEAIREGIDVLKEIDPDDRLAILLEVVWVER